MLVGEPFFQARPAEGVQAVEQRQWLIEHFSADEADQLLLEIQETCRSCCWRSRSSHGLVVGTLFIIGVRCALGSVLYEVATVAIADTSFVASRGRM